MTPRKRMLLGLAVLETVREYGETVTQEDLAEICGCTQQAIQQIEVKALNKLRRLAKRQGT